MKSDQENAETIRIGVSKSDDQNVHLSPVTEKASCTMVNWGRTRTISIAVCVVLFCGYLYVEFGVKRDQVIEVSVSHNDVMLQDVQRHNALVGEDHVEKTGESREPNQVDFLDFGDHEQNKNTWVNQEPDNQGLVNQELDGERDRNGGDLDNLEQEQDQSESGETAETADTAATQKPAEPTDTAVTQKPAEPADTAITQKPAEPVDTAVTQKPVKPEETAVAQKPAETQQKDTQEPKSSDTAAATDKNAVIVRKFDPDKPKFILLLAQQRVGSTFIGGIFDRNPKAIYVYEPLEGVYTHLYGTKKGWAVPLDIHFHWNKTYRALPAYEMQAVARLIEQIFTCDYQHMLTEFLVHEFWGTFKQTEAKPYVECLRQIKVSLSKCQAHIGAHCESRVGQNLPKEKHCHEQLELVFSGKPAEEPFKKYKICMDTQRAVTLQKCVPIVDKICKSKALTVIKTVRMDMETIVPLMDKYPNMRVVHLIRDPRSVVLSRIKSGWSTHGTTALKAARDSLKSHNPKMSSLPAYHVNSSVDYDEFSLGEELKSAPTPPNAVAQEAQMYCSLTRKDIITRRYLEQKYPGSTYQMIYDHMVDHPVHELERIYEFINEPIPASIMSWVKTLNSGTKTSQSIASKWRKEMSVESAKQIDKFCQNLYDTIEYSWPDPVRP